MSIALLEKSCPVIKECEQRALLLADSDTLAFIQYTVERFRQWNIPPPEPHGS